MVKMDKYKMILILTTETRPYILPNAVISIYLKTGTLLLT